MSNRVNLSARDRSLLRLLSLTPATTRLLLRASAAFDDGPFADERRLRERLMVLGEAGFVRSWPAASGSRGLANVYKLTPLGFEILNGVEAVKPPRTFFTEVSPSLFDHTMRLAEVIVEVTRACHARRVTIERFYRENELTFKAGDEQTQPDCFVRLRAGGRFFNLAFEIDNSTESLDSPAANSVRRKLATYQAYQDRLLTQWLAGGRNWERPRFRVVFLTRAVERAYHILWFASELARNKSRHLVYAATHESFVTDGDPLHAPIFLDHLGGWQSLIDEHPTATYRKTPVRLPRPVNSPMFT